MDPLTEILNERARQDEKWGEQDHDNLYWLAILSEEVGELAEALLCDYTRVRPELVQVAAVALAWLECMERHSH